MYEILIVDDSVLDIDCIIFLIKKFELPLHPVKAVNGNEALSLIKKKETHFDILLTDIKRPAKMQRQITVCRPEKYAVSPPIPKSSFSADLTILNMPNPQSPSG